MPSSGVLQYGAAGVIYAYTAANGKQRQLLEQPSSSPITFVGNDR
jgi:hypothetical protein